MYEGALNDLAKTKNEILKCTESIEKGESILAQLNHDVEMNLLEQSAAFNLLNSLQTDILFDPKIFNYNSQKFERCESVVKKRGS